MAAKYKVIFKDIKNERWVIEFHPKDYNGTAIELRPGEVPLTIEYETSDNKFEPVLGKTITVSFKTGGIDVSDLYTIDPMGIKVLIYRDYQLWEAGFVNCELFSVTHTRINADVSITANDGLGAIDRLDYFETYSQEWDFDIASLKQVILNCLQGFTISRYVVMFDYKETNHTTGMDVIDNIFVDPSNYIDEDGESFSKRKVLETLLTPFGLSLRIVNSMVLIYDASLIANASYEVRRYNSDFADPTTLTITKKIDFSDHNEIKWATDAESTIISGFNKIIVNYLPSPDNRKLFPFTKDKVPNVYSFANCFDTTPDTPVPPLNPKTPGTPANPDVPRIGNWFNESKVFNAPINKTTGALIQPDLSYYGIEFNGILPDYYSNYGYMRSNSLQKTASEVLVFHQPYPYNVHTLYLTIKGGRIKYSPDYIKIKINMGIWEGYFFYDSSVEERQITLYQTRMYIKIGSYYGVWDQATKTFNMTATTETWNQVEIEDNKGSFMNNDFDFEFNIAQITHAGNFEIKINNNYSWIQNYAGGRELPSEYCYTVFNSFEVLPAGKEIDASAKEYVAYTTKNFKKEKTIEINHGDYRRGGILDRGCLWVSNTIPCRQWYRASIGNARMYNIFQMLLNTYHSNYYKEYLQLKGEIKGTNLLKENISAPPTFENFGFLIGIKETNWLGNRVFMVSGGTFYAATNRFEGTFTEIMPNDANLIVQGVLT